MEDVKKEKFGSRKSILKSILIDNKIKFISNLWVITCRNAINPNKNNRYLVCIEGEYNNEEYRDLLNKINKNITILNLNFNEKNRTAFINDLKDNKTETLSYEDLKNKIIESTNCKFVESYAMGSSESTPLSRFFRENMGKGFALTDIDFYISEKKIFIEEKNFINDTQGYLGVGQCISFKEIVNDIFNGLDLKIICNDGVDFFMADVNKINCGNTKVIHGWGKMVVFGLEKINKKDIINYLKGVD